MFPRWAANLVARLTSSKKSEQFRAIGTLILVCGVAGACVYYFVNARAAGPSMDDLLPGYTRARTREVGIMMGQFGVIMTDWTDALAQPGMQAVLIAGVCALIALYFFRAAWVMDDADRHAASDAHGHAGGGAH